MDVRKPTYEEKEKGDDAYMDMYNMHMHMNMYMLYIVRAAATARGWKCQKIQNDACTHGIKSKGRKVPLGSNSYLGPGWALV